MSGVMRVYGVAVCADCLQYYTHQEGTSRQHASAYAKGKASYSNNPNELVCMYIDADMYTEHSANPCEICSSPLHGIRYFGSIKIVL